MESLAGKQIYFCFNNKFPLTAALPLIFLTVSQIDRITKGRRRATVLWSTAANYLKQQVYGQLAKKLLNQFLEFCLNGRWFHSSHWFLFRMHTHWVEKPGSVRNVWHFCCQCACTLEFAIFRSPLHPSMHEFSRNLIAWTAQGVRDVRLYQIKHTTWFLWRVFHTKTLATYSNPGANGPVKLKWRREAGKASIGYSITLQGRAKIH